MAMAGHHLALGAREEAKKYCALAARQMLPPVLQQSCSQRMVLMKRLSSGFESTAALATKQLVLTCRSQAWVVGWA